MRGRFEWICMAVAVAVVASQPHDRELLEFSASSASSASSNSNDDSGNAGLLPTLRPNPPMPTSTSPIPSPITAAPTPVPTPKPIPSRPNPGPIDPDPPNPSPAPPPATTPPPPPPAPTPMPAPTSRAPPAPSPTGSHPWPPRPIPPPNPDPPPDPPSPSPPVPMPIPVPPAPTHVPTGTPPAGGPMPSPVPTPPPDSPSPPVAGTPTTSPPRLPAKPTPPPDVESPSPPPPPSPPRPGNPPTNPSKQPALPSTPTTPAPPSPGGGDTDAETRESTTPAPPSDPGAPSSSSSPSSPSSSSEPEAETTPAPTPKRYQRGDDVVIITTTGNGTDVAVEVVVSPSQSPAVVVRDTDKDTTNARATTASGSDTNDSEVYSFLQYLTSLLALASLFLLIGCHFLAPQPSRPDAESSAAALSSSNQWELLAFITYIQTMASSAHYVVRVAPAYYWRFVDAFSWTVFLPFHSSGSGITYSKTLGMERRLTDVVVLDGLIAFADRIGVNEEDLLETSVAGFLVGCGALFVVAIATIYYVRVHKDDAFESDTPAEQLPPDCSQAHSVNHELGQATQQTAYPLLVVSGLVVIFAAFAFYPLLLMASFEIASQIRASEVSGGSLTIALLALFFVCAVFIAKSLAAMASARDAHDSYQNGRRYRTVWGSLCTSDCINYESRVLFVILWLLMQVLSAVTIGCVRSEKVQLVLLIAVDVAFVASLMVFRPFNYNAKAAILVICGVAIVKAVNTALCFAFLSTNSSSTSHRRAVATAFIALNSALIILWFVRLLFLTCVLVRSAWGERRSVHKNPNALMDSGRSSTPDSTRHQSTQYIAITPDQHIAAA